MPDKGKAPAGKKSKEDKAKEKAGRKAEKKKEKAEKKASKRESRKRKRSDKDSEEEGPEEGPEEVPERNDEERDEIPHEDRPESPKHHEGLEDVAGGSGSGDIEAPPSPTKMELLKKLGIDMKMVERIKAMDPLVRNDKVAKLGTEVCNSPVLFYPSLHHFFLT